MLIAVVGSVSYLANAVVPDEVDISSQIHEAEGRIVSSQHAYQVALNSHARAADNLRSATKAEASLLFTAVFADQDIGMAARDIYINNNLQEASLIADVAQNGPQAFADNQKTKYLTQQISNAMVMKAIGIKERTDMARIKTAEAIANYAQTTVNLFTAHVESLAARDTFEALLEANNITFTGSMATIFTESTTILPGAVTAVARSLSFVGQPWLACDDGLCYRLCDHLAGQAWGYANSGYETAREHWAVMEASGSTHPNDTNPPLGALLFWNTGLYGHVAVYVGDGMIVTNMKGRDGYSVYLIPASEVSQLWGAEYWGWSDPVFIGQRESE
jgi:cell wall-associated NlpC family hydrolase